MAEAKIRISAQDDASATINRVSLSAQKMAAAFGSIVGLGIGVALGAAVRSISQMAGALQELDKASQNLGVTAAQLSEFRAAARLSGVEATLFDSAIGRLSEKLQDAAAGNRNAVRLFKDLGVSFKDTRGNVRPVVDVLEDLSRVFRGAADGSGKTALAMEALGRGSKQMVAYLNQGPAALREFTGVTPQAIEEAKKLQKEIDALGNSWQRFANKVLGLAIPAINKLIDDMRGGGRDERIALLQDQIASMEKNNFPSKTIKSYRDELAALKRDLADESLQRFLSGGAAARRADITPSVLTQTDQAAIDAANKLFKELEDARVVYRQESSKQREQIDKEAAARYRATFERQLKEENEAVDAAFEERQAASRRREQEEDARGDRYKQFFDRNAEGAQKFNDLVDQLGMSLDSAFNQLFTGGGFQIKDLFKTLAADVLQFMYKLLILKPILDGIKNSMSGWNIPGLGSVAGARAMGGPVVGGSAYLVGEQGPEFFVPSVSGTIVPNGMGGVSIVQNVSVDARSDIATVRQAMAAAKAEAVYEVQQQLARRGALARA